MKRKRQKEHLEERAMKQNDDGRKSRRRIKHIIKERRNSEKNSE